MRASRCTRIHASILPALLLALMALMAPMLAAPALAEEGGCQGGERVTPVTAFGRPQTTFSRETAATEEDLQRLFVTYEDDLRKVLELANWDGDPDELFSAVRGGEAEEVSLPPGTEFEWMAFRKRGQPACVKNIMWKGAEPFPAWSVEVESKGYDYTLTIPKTCLNLSMTRGARRMAPPPTCALTASFDAESDAVTVRGSTDGAEISVTGIREPNGAGDLAMLESVGENVWTYKPTDDGRYSFTANARRETGSQNTECSASVDVERPKPMMAPPGPSVDEPESSPAEAELEDAPMSEAGAMRKATKGSWVLRLFGAAADASGDSIMTGPVRQDPNDLLSPFVSTKRMIGDGTGFGLGLERLLNDRFGVELDALFIDLDGNRIFDMGDEWTMSNPGVGFDAISLGLNVHLTPEKPYDVFIGPFVSNVSFSDSGFNASEPDFGSEIGIGAKIGADWYFSGQGKWALATSIRYLPITAGDGANEFDVDPLIGTVGLGVRF